MPLVIPVEIRFADIDKLGHVNNAVYLSYFEQARLSYFQQVIGANIDWSENGIILARAEINYILPVNLEDNIIVEISCSRTGTKSFDLEYKLFKQSGDKNILATEGKTIMVCYNYKASQTIAIPVNWANKIRVFEGINGM